MSETKKTKNTDAENEDWAVLPFDEAEDNARWAKLGGELDEVFEKTISTEKLTGTILMENDLSCFVSQKSQAGDDEAEDEELF